MSPETLFGICSDQTRLRALMLLLAEDELCVCELTFALEESQPKISRHLALMREAGVVESRREGIWMHYRISDELPEWGRQLVQHTCLQISDLKPFNTDRHRLEKMSDRPERACA